MKVSRVPLVTRSGGLRGRVDQAAARAGLDRSSISVDIFVRNYISRES